MDSKYMHFLLPTVLLHTSLWSPASANYAIEITILDFQAPGIMSRSALWRQEGNVKERERQAEELFQLAVEEGRVGRLFLSPHDI
eukprot:scaffold22661_cov200-Cylindrotheca_fusiformis.AAC.4